jgi:hypothetical protein
MSVSAARWGAVTPEVWLHVGSNTPPSTMMLARMVWSSRFMRGWIAMRAYGLARRWTVNQDVG